MLFAIDLDNCLAAYDGWKGQNHVGAPMPGAVEACNALAEAGHSLIVFSCRTCDAPTIEGDKVPEPQADRAGAKYAIVQWLAYNGFPSGMQVWDGPGKPFADVYADDRAWRLAPREDPEAWPKFLEFVEQANASG